MRLTHIEFVIDARLTPNNAVHFRMWVRVCVCLCASMQLGSALFFRTTLRRCTCNDHRGASIEKDEKKRTNKLAHSFDDTFERVGKKSHSQQNEPAFLLNAHTNTSCRTKRIIVTGKVVGSESIWSDATHSGTNCICVQNRIARRENTKKHFFASGFFSVLVSFVEFCVEHRYSANICAIG